MKLLLFVMCLTALFLTSGTIISNAQETPAKDSKSVKNILSEIVRAKNQNKPFVLITPDDLSKLSATELDAVLNTTGPCDTATPITVNQSVNGQLTSADCRLDDGSYADFYSFNGVGGQNITLSMNSAAFDTYLGIANDTGTFVLEDDDGGGGTNSRINTNLPATGLYIILANSVFPNQFGDYTLNLTSVAACTYSISPTSATIAPEGGTFTFTVNTQFGCQWATGAASDFLRTNSTGTGTGTVTYTATPNDFNGTRTGTIIVRGLTFTVTQPSLNCTFSINPTSVTVPGARNTGSFTITTQNLCSWTARNNDAFISAFSSGTGSGTVPYTVIANNGADRTGTISVGGQIFTINQLGLNCTFSVSPTSISVDRFENYGTISVTTQPGCSWSAGGGISWIILDTSSGTGSGTINYRITFNNFAPRTAIIPVYYGLEPIRITVTQSNISTRTGFDFDFDGKADIAVYRPSDGVWYLNQSQNGFAGFQFGSSTDKIVPADYDGDGKTDIAVYRDGTWYLLRSIRGFTSVQFGLPEDIPVPADYDGDGKADIAVYRPSNGVWYYINSNTNFVSIVQFGISEDKPTIGDFDGDGKSDIAVYRPSSGVWYRLNSGNGSFFATQFGISEDKPTPADYDGDGKSDIAVFRPSDGTWYRLNSSNNQFVAIQFGILEDKPTAADYDGDGKADIAVYRPSSGIWYLLNSTTGFSTQQFGILEDKPAPNAFVR